jgi:DNA-binding transcriptional ArsR family regulator
LKPRRNISDPDLAKALAHPLRVAALAVLEERTASPSEIAAELGASLGQVSYHVRTLARYGLVTLVETRPKRGALEHYYRAEPNSHLLRSPMVLDERGWNELSAKFERLRADCERIAAASAKRLAAAGEDGAGLRATVVLMLVETTPDA